jgi:hypothetical protein
LHGLKPRNMQISIVGLLFQNKIHFLASNFRNIKIIDFQTYLNINDNNKLNKFSKSIVHPTTLSFLKRHHKHQAQYTTFHITYTMSLSQSAQIF